MVFDDLRIYQITGLDAVFAEFQGQATVIKTGRHYRQNHVVHLRAEGREIVFAREYFGPARVVAAFS